MKRLLPAYPLFVKDPYFSIWAQTEVLNEKDVIFWTGEEKRLYGYIRTGGRCYRFLGRGEGLRAKQISLGVSAFTTDYRFEAGSARLSLSFVSPLPLDNPDMFSCPVCYMNYEVEGTDDAEIIFIVGQNICYNGEEFRPVRGGAADMGRFETAFFGLRKQAPFSDDNDRVCADWGYWYLSGERACCASAEDVRAYLEGGAYPAAAEGECEKVLLSFSRAPSGKVMLAFEDIVGINYFGDFLRGLYLADHSVFDALSEVYVRSADIDVSLARFDEEMRRRAEVYGGEYVNVLCASLRQSAGAHKLLRDRDGNLLFISKECFSNGCAGTVDVSYPSAPLYLLYNPELVRGMLRPVLKFAKMPVWRYGFAPHDAGAYPDCCGQVYGLKNSDFTLFGDGQTRPRLWQLPPSADIYDLGSQMPVEECANVLIMLAAAYRADGDSRLIRAERALLEGWANYLVSNGLRPENQLCTDDFSGHLKNNINLAIKAAVAIACYAEMCMASGDGTAYREYRSAALSFSSEIVALEEERGHLPLTWDSDSDTYSLKYNLAFDRLLGLGLFPESLCEREVDFCLTKCKKYGIPLDGRADFTKSDWLLFMASLTRSDEKRRQIAGLVDGYLRESPDRLPFGDWYDSESGRLIGFRNRSVQGANFILLLADSLKLAAAEKKDVTVKISP